MLTNLHMIVKLKTSRWFISSSSHNYWWQWHWCSSHLNFSKQLNRSIAASERRCFNDVFWNESFSLEAFIKTKNCLFTISHSPLYNFLGFCTRCLAARFKLLKEIQKRFKIKIVHTLSCIQNPPIKWIKHKSFINSLKFSNILDNVK